jgi:hypothetical protein
MSAAPSADAALDDVIAEITIDCFNEDEQLQAFENAFEEHAGFPCPGCVVGEHVEILSATTRSNRRELIATCRRDGRAYQVALLDVTLDADPATSRLLAAYRRWSGD